MTVKKAKQVAKNYWRILRDTDESDSPALFGVSHIKSLCARLQEIPFWKKGKVMRWLGFIQGWLWARGYYTIEELKDHNRGDQP